MSTENVDWKEDLSNLLAYFTDADSFEEGAIDLAEQNIILAADHQKTIRALEHGIEICARGDREALKILKREGYTYLEKVLEAEEILKSILNSYRGKYKAALKARRQCST